MELGLEPIEIYLLGGLAPGGGPVYVIEATWQCS